MTTHFEPRVKRPAGGFTLIELLISVLIFVVLMGGVFGLLNRAQWDFVRQRDANRAMETVRSAELAITTMLRSAEADPMATGLALLDPDPLGRGKFDNLRVRADLNPSDGYFGDPLEDVTFWVETDTLYVRWQEGAEPEPLAYPVKSLAFEYFSMNGTPITDEAVVPWAKAVKITIVADRGTRSDRDERRETWVQLRNRRY